MKTERSVVDIKKNILLKKILFEIYKKGASTLANLADKFNTSVPSATLCMQELLSHKWIEEVGSARTHNGRRPQKYDLNPDRKKVMIVVINIFHVDIYSINLRNKVDFNEKVLLNVNDKSFVPLLSDAIEKFKKGKKIWCIGIVSPGLLQLETGNNYSFPYHTFENFSLGKYIEQISAIPTFTRHDMQMAALGEHHFGLAFNQKNVFVLNVDFTIGLGIISEGQVIHGANGYAGELGHVLAVENGEICYCEKKGCLETVASASAILKKAQLGLNPKTSLSSLNRTLFIEDIVEAAIEGDMYSRQLIVEAAYEIGKSLSFAIQMFNPSMIILDGVLSQSGDILLFSIKNALQKYCLFDFKKDLKIEISTNKLSSKVLGMKSTLFSKMLTDFAIFPY